MVIKHILIAHDLRSTADLALRRAAQLARQHHARLTLLHVTESHQPPTARESAEQALDESLTRYAPVGSELRLMTGRPADVVLSQVQALKADLLVLGAHHQRHDFFSGTTLDRIARGCPIPLLLASIDDDAPYQHALAALNFSLCACSAFGHAYRLLPTTAELHALHVFEAPKGSSAEIETQHATQRMLIEQLVRDEVQNLPAKGPRVSQEVQLGTLPRTLHEALGKYQPQLLVLGCHGRGALSQALLGSLAQHCLHKAPCDVLVVQ